MKYSLYGDHSLYEGVKFSSLFGTGNESTPGTFHRGWLGVRLALRFLENKK